METGKIILIGGGQHGRVVFDSLIAQGADVIALFDPRYTGDFFGVPHRGDYDPSFEPEAHVIVAIGDNVSRKRIADSVEHLFGNTIHPSAVLSPVATLGHGNMILQGAIIQSMARIGNHVILNTGAQVDHDCVVGDFVHIAPKAVLCGRVEIGEGTMIGAGATITPGTKVGAWAMIGAGAVIIRDVPDYAVVVGNPGRVIKTVKP
jgi:sugar O-acyltransferase (sialic acid O-acetyltransferase NeuD family)